MQRNVLYSDLKQKYWIVHCTPRGIDWLHFACALIELIKRSIIYMINNIYVLGVRMNNISEFLFVADVETSMLTNVNKVGEGIKRNMRV